MAHVEDKDGNCYARWKDELGKWKAKKIGRHTRATHSSALMIAQHQETEAIKRKYSGLPLEPRKVPLIDAWEQYRAWAIMNKAESSFTRDEYSIKPLLEAFPCNLQDITSKEIEDAMIGWRKEVSPATANRHFALLSHIFTKSMEWGYVTYDPTKQVKKFREPEGRVRCLELEEIDSLITHAAKHLPAMIYTALNAGARAGNITSLTWDHVDFTRRTITFPKTKNHKALTVPMTDELIKVLKAVPRAISSPYVFCDVEGKPYKRVVKGFRAACQRAGIKDFRFHDLRHTFASHFIRQGGDLKTLQELLGHKTIAMTIKYAHLFQPHLQREIKRIDNLFGGNHADDTHRANG
jgi:integrase